MTTRRLPVTAGTSLLDGRRPRGTSWSVLVFDASVWCDRGPSPAGNPGPYLKVPSPSTDDSVHRVYPRAQPGTLLDGERVVAVRAWQADDRSWFWEVDVEPAAPLDVLLDVARPVLLRRAAEAVRRGPSWTLVVTPCEGGAVVTLRPMALLLADLGLGGEAAARVMARERAAALASEDRLRVVVLGAGAPVVVELALECAQAARSSR
jgi:hypothetical protein